MSQIQIPNLEKRVKKYARKKILSFTYFSKSKVIFKSSFTASLGLNPRSNKVDSMRSRRPHRKYFDLIQRDVQKSKGGTKAV